MDKITEYQMAWKFKKILGTKNIDRLPEFSIVYNEVNGIQGIADFVAINTHNKSILKDIKNFKKIISIDSGTFIISLLKKRQVRTKEYIVNKTGLGEKTIRKVIGELLKNNVIIEAEKDKYILSSEFNIPEVDIWAFELKLSNWKRALFQAMQYKAFADYSFIVMPIEKRDLLQSKLHIFQEFNVGIMLFDTQNQNIELLIKPRKDKVVSLRQRCFILAQMAYRNQE